MRKHFIIMRTGDPYNKTGWDIHEIDGPDTIFRGDLSPIQGRDNAIWLLRRLYQDCKITVQKP